MNLFLSTRRLVTGKEDHLTEFSAGALDIDPSFRQSYVDFVLRPFAKRNQWPPPVISAVDTQRPFPGCCPDMCLTLQDGHLIVCEHKIDAIETMGPEGDDGQEPAAQLERYLGLPVDGLVYVRAGWKPPDLEVLNNEKYVRPHNREHSLWRDFFPLLEGSTHPFTAWICEGFRRLGFTPPHPVVGDLSVPENRRNFAKLWSATRSLGHSLGWRVGTGSVVELYFDKPASSLASKVWVCPRDEQLLVRATPREKANESEVESRLHTVAARLPIPAEVERHSVRRVEGKAVVIDAWCPLRLALREAQTREDLERKLVEFVGPFLMALT